VGFALDNINMEEQYIREKIQDKTSGYLHFDKRRNLGSSRKFGG
jgi:hypothetical protein